MSEEEYYSFNPKELRNPVDWKGPIATTADEMACVLFTALFARFKYLDMQSFTADELEAAMGDRSYDSMTRKALDWLAQL